MQLSVCQICKYPVWSYICPDCLSAEISRWLPRELSAEFREFSRSFLGHFTSFESNLTRTMCIRCRTMKETTLCSFCYVTEAFNWLHEKDRELGRALFMALPLDASMKAASSASEWSEIKPISYAEESAAERICEECGEDSGTEESDGRRLCADCMG